MRHIQSLHKKEDAKDSKKKEKVLTNCLSEKTNDAFLLI